MATNFIRRKPDSVMEWEIQDVLDWLKELKLEQFYKRFQSHAISGPILLQMDDLLLDDLHITSKADRQILLAESRRLCLQELQLVGKALKYKQKTAEEIEKSTTENKIMSTGNKTDEHNEHLFVQTKLSTQQRIDATKLTDEAAFEPLRDDIEERSSEGRADEIATRATLMVTILSQENSKLRTQLEECSKKDHCLHVLQGEISKLRAENKELKTKVRVLQMENQKVLEELKQLQHAYSKLQETCKKYEDIQEHEAIIKQLRQDNVILQEKFKKLKHQTLEREVMTNLSNGVNMKASKNPIFSLQSPQCEERRCDDVLEDHDLQMINKVYTANKRCAELEDTIRWLYAEILLENRKYQRRPTLSTDVEEEQAPREPEWPSLVGSVALNEANQDRRTDGHVSFINHLMTQGLPTDNDEDIWTRTSDKTKISLKGIHEGRSDELLLHYWSV